MQHIFCRHHYDGKISAKTAQNLCGFAQLRLGSKFAKGCKKGDGNIIKMVRQEERGKGVSV